MENNVLPNSAITASTVWRTVGHEPWLARLNNVKNGHMGSWSAEQEGILCAHASPWASLCRFGAEVCFVDTFLATRV